MLNLKSNSILLLAETIAMIINEGFSVIINTEKKTEMATWYRPELDGLRAVAIALVIGFHMFPRMLPGGLIGVDIFFVISGYLITYNILRKNRTNSFKKIEFYTGRIKRIFPPLILLLVFLIVVGKYLFFRPEYYNLIRDSIYGSLFIENFGLIKRNGDYFAENIKYTPLAHLWSLGIEEQFYIIWPFIICWADTKKNAVRILLFLVFASFGLGLVTSQFNPILSFYLPVTRFWEIFLGGLLVYVEKNTFIKEKYQNVLGCYLAFFLLILATIKWPLNSNYFYFYQFRSSLAVAGSCLLILLTPKNLLCNKVLTSNFFIYIGKISYSLYLWHWTILSLGWIVWGDQGTTLNSIIGVAICTGLSLISYHAIETPIRNSKHRILPIVLMLFMLLIAIYSFRLVYLKKIETYFHSLPVGRSLDSATPAWTIKYNFWDRPFPFQPASGFPKLSEPFFGVGKASTSISETVLFLGDSNMKQYIPRIARLLSAKDNCRSVAYVGYGLWRSATPVSDAIILSEDNAISTVVLCFDWYTHANTRNIEITYNQIHKTIKELSARGKAVYLVLNIPMDDELLPTKAVTRKFDTSWPFVLFDYNPNIVLLNKQEWLKKSHKIAHLGFIAAESGARVLDPAPLLLQGETFRGFSNDGKAVYYDKRHLSPDWVGDHMTILDNIILVRTEIQN